ncbi:MAG: UDP-N-acetylmuramoyl-tripeptide--D-alanyl-D-alanine ligase [Hoylesella enoeca]|uniref:UDP-N-acetylmuramoyl-tripeptide--D-alanyl-D- alanine ligase n=1 Tax=Hoylesella enoeca TaxID=76123 RepID=UPI003F9F4A18
MEISELYKLFVAHPTVTTDSRNCPEGSIFFALKGASFNGNRFAEKALEQGCSYAVIDEDTARRSVEDSRLILVDDSLKTLQQLANYHRRTLGTPMIGITGTNGKTTTKELVSAVLAEKYNVLFTEGNFNNDIGVPKTLLRLTREHELAVVEMGASHPGDIRTLVDIAEPDFALVTNVGKAHLQGFGSFEGVMRTKAELYDFMQVRRPDGLIFINADNAFLGEMRRDHCPSVRCVTYGQGKEDGIRFHGEVIDCAPFLHFRWREEGKTAGWNDVRTHLIGAYNLDNMLAAISIGTHFGVSAAQIGNALARYIPGNNRSQLEETVHNHLIMDAYNANPTSMNAALLNFRDMAVGPKMAILGDMRELGEQSFEEHTKIVSLLETLPFEEVWLVGEEFGRIECRFRKFANVEEVKAALCAHRPEGFYILIKGSNGIHLAELAEML